MRIAIWPKVAVTYTLWYVNLFQATCLPFQIVDKDFPILSEVLQIDSLHDEVKEVIVNAKKKYDHFRFILILVKTRYKEAKNFEKVELVMLTEEVGEVEQEETLAPPSISCFYFFIFFYHLIWLQ